MKSINVIMVRVYVTESSGLLNKLINHLRNVVKVRGVSVFRAISGFGETGSHTASLVDLSLDLPLAIEFFDEESKVKNALEWLNNIIKPEHIVFWTAQANQPN